MKKMVVFAAVVGLIAITSAVYAASGPQENVTIQFKGPSSLYSEHTKGVVINGRAYIPVGSVQSLVSAMGFNSRWENGKLDVGTKSSSQGKNSASTTYGHVPSVPVVYAKDLPVTYTDPGGTKIRFNSIQLSDTQTTINLTVLDSSHDGPDFSFNSLVIGPSSYDQTGASPQLSSITQGVTATGNLFYPSLPSGTTYFDFQWFDNPGPDNTIQVRFLLGR